MTWHPILQPLDDRTLWCQLGQAGRRLHFAEVIDGWRDPATADAFCAMLAAAPFPAFFWEMPPLTVADLARPFECVLVDSPGLARAESAERGVFARYFRAGELTATFPNLGGDALLVAPTPGEPPEAFIHLAAFVRGAPRARQRALWRAAAAALGARLGRRPLWVSTSGLGVYWLHLRLDERPKYYQHAPYRVPPGGASTGPV